MSGLPLISFDYAIKYLLKDKGDYSIVEGFISAVLKSVGYSEVKIIALLESEGGKEDSRSTRSLADVIVEDKNKNKYIIEIERNVKDSFTHKSCFNTSWLIVDNLVQREDYTQIVKVFHISLLYFPIGNGPIYHGKTIIHEVETNERLNVHITNQETKEVFNATEILPEYFYISVPLFSDRLEKEIDDWLYVMKHDEVPKKFHSRYMNQVSEKLNILTMSLEDRANYSYYRKKLCNDRDELKAAESRDIEKAIEQGIAKGKSEEKLEIARNLLSANLQISFIANATGLSEAAIKELQKK